MVWRAKRCNASCTPDEPPCTFSILTKKVMTNLPDPNLYNDCLLFTRQPLLSLIWISTLSIGDLSLYSQSNLAHAYLQGSRWVWSTTTTRSTMMSRWSRKRSNSVFVGGGWRGRGGVKVSVGGNGYYFTFADLWRTQLFSFAVCWISTTTASEEDISTRTTFILCRWRFTPTSVADTFVLYL